MLYRRLGSSELKLSALSYGARVTFDQRIDDDVAAKCMPELLDRIVATVEGEGT